ncbi:MAG: IMP cyclohydrolase [Lentisphaeria bacterium]|jgi:IMP cyclohydrolase|nr:IMP cyclohydrolase [Lentisphaeria bacterium]MDP7742436.1 IMP cyclohydrolase [Lentisphaeria bacterium]
MYVGRIVAVGRNANGTACGLYRVSSRSFPNREARILENSVAILPKPGHEDDIYKNPYIAYNCVKLVGNHAVVTNGAHTDFIAEKIAAGLSPRDALSTVLLAMDYEHDSYNTPRIAAVIDNQATACLGIVTDQSLLVTAIDLAPGTAHYVATYEHTVPGQYGDTAFDVANADAACQYILGQGVFAELERPITAACAVADGDRFQIAIADA